MVNQCFPPTAMLAAKKAAFHCSGIPTHLRRGSSQPLGTETSRGHGDSSVPELPLPCSSSPSKPLWKKRDEPAQRKPCRWSQDSPWSPCPPPKLPLVHAPEATMAIPAHHTETRHRCSSTLTSTLGPIPSAVLQLSCLRSGTGGKLSGSKSQRSFSPGTPILPFPGALMLLGEVSPSSQLMPSTPRVSLATKQEHPLTLLC